MTERFVTISVDDGHVTDLQTAELLHKYDLTATFYIPARNPERPVASAQQIGEIARSFEVGAHTFHHIPLTSLSEQLVWKELQEGKEWLQQTVGSTVVSFCYPRGKFSRKISELVSRAGFIGARTCMYHLYGFPEDPFLWGVSTHASFHSRAIQVRHALLECNLRGAWNFVRIHKAATDWYDHFVHGLDYVETHGGIAHLYLHSWEIDANNEWEKLESAFRAIAERTTLLPLTNGQLFKQWKAKYTYAPKYRGRLANISDQ